MKKAICKDIVANGENIGIINYNNEKGTYSAEVLLNGPKCMRIINEAKNIRNKNTTRIFKEETKENLNTEINSFIETTIPNVKYEISDQINK